MEVVHCALKALNLVEISLTQRADAATNKHERVVLNDTDNKHLSCDAMIFWVKNTIKIEFPRIYVHIHRYNDLIASEISHMIVLYARSYNTRAEGTHTCNCC